MMLAFADALNLRATAAEFLFQSLKAAIQMIDAVDHGFTFSGECSDHEGYRGAQICCHHGRTFQSGIAFDNRKIAIKFNLGA